MGEGSRLMHSSILEKIDGLFACNIGEYINLPQLVVVGNQSSGKSSVLAALTDLPFPRDSGLCTRFATQITFRRAKKDEISVSIIPNKHSDDGHQEKMKQWQKSLGTWNAEAFGSLMQEAATVMGVGQSAEEATSMAFSRDVLVIEVSGPSQEHFSVIDVPGTFKRTTSGLTTKDDMALVDAMVHEYMANPRSVMLTVVPCNVDIATQDIIEKAEDLDPDGDRTFGILTKPDLVDQGAENAVVDLIEGKRQKLKLGWHLLRNPGQADTTSSLKARGKIEQSFFSSITPWNTLPKEKVGIQSLRIRLQDILAGHLRREFPKVKSEMSAKLKRATNELNALGKKRQTEFEQREFLMEIAANFQDVVVLAINASYGRSEFFDEDGTAKINSSLRLATMAVSRGEDFSRCMKLVGHEIEFERVDSSNNLDPAELDPALAEISKFRARARIEKVGGDEKAPDEKTICYSPRFESTPNDIDDILPDLENIDEPKSLDILGWISSVYRKSRGFEIATFDPALVAITMKQQAKKWGALSVGYISDIVCVVHNFVMKLLIHLTSGSNGVATRIASVLLDELRAKYEASLKHVEFLLKVELGGTPATYNPDFGEKLDHCRNERLKTQMSKMRWQDGHGNEVVRLTDITSIQNKDSEELVAYEIYDTLFSYYELSRKRFVDNVRMQVADHFLVTGTDSPLRLFSPKYVASMTTEKLEELVGEEFSVKRRRAEIEREIERLRKGRRILQ